MRELYDFDKMVRNIEESYDVIDSNDFGSFRNLNSVSRITGMSFLEELMNLFIGDLVAHGLSDEKATFEVETAIEELISTLALDAIPMDASDGQIAMWVSRAKPLIKSHLQLKGLIY